MKIAAYTVHIIWLAMCVFFLPNTLLARSQTPSADSLRRVFSEQKRQQASSETLGLTLELIGQEFYKEHQYDSTIFTLHRALDLLRNSENWKSQEHCAMLIHYSFEQLEQIDSVLVWAKKAQRFSDHLPGDIHNNYCSIGYAFQQMRVIDSAEHYFKKCLEYRKQYQLHERILEAYGNLQYLYENTSRSDLQYLTIVEKINYCRDQKAPLDLADALFTKGLFLSKMNDSAAVTAYKEALHFSDSVGAIQVQSRILTGLGEIFSTNGDQKRALEYFRRAEQISLENDQPKTLAYAYINMSESYYAMGDYLMAEEMILKAHKINVQSGYKHQEPYVYAAWAQVLLKLGKLKPAENVVLSGIDKATKDANKDILVRLLQTYIRILLTENKVNEARQQLNAIMEVCKETGLDLHVEYCLESELEIMRASGDLRGENRVLQQLRELDKKLASAGMAENIDRIHYVLELEANQRENALLKQRAIAQEDFIVQQRLFIFLFVTGMLTLAVLSFLLYQNRRKLDRYVQELEQRNQSILELNDMKDILFKIISHDLRGPIGNMQPLIELIRRSIQNQEYDDVPSIADVLQKQSKSAYITLTNLLNWTLSQRDEISIHKEAVNLVESVESAMEFLKIQADEKGIHLDHTTHNAPKVLADKNMLETIIRNLISNAIKFTNQNGVITIACERQHYNKVRISVIDTGVGMSEEQVAQIFSRALFTSKAGTQGESGSGVGLKLCIDLVKKLDSELKVVTVMGQGSMFYFELSAADYKG